MNFNHDICLSYQAQTELQHISKHNFLIVKKDIQYRPNVCEWSVYFIH